MNEEIMYKEIELNAEEEAEAKNARLALKAALEDMGYPEETAQVLKLTFTKASVDKPVGRVQWVNGGMMADGKPFYRLTLVAEGKEIGTGPGKTDDTVCTLFYIGMELSTQLVTNKGAPHITQDFRASITDCSNDIVRALRNPPSYVQQELSLKPRLQPGS